VQTTLAQAWGLWLSGEPAAHLELWGLSILWWGRLGKIAEAVAGLAILADIVGPDGLRRFGRLLHGRFTLATAGHHMRNAMVWLLWWWKYVKAKQSSPEEREAEQHMQEFGVLQMLLGAIGVVVIIVVMVENWGDWKAVVSRGLGALFVVGLVGPFLVALLIIAFAMLGLLFDLVVIEPVARAFDRDAPDRLIKIGSLLLLVLGFHFDLLAS
jgi:hypothetical protein